MNFTTNMGQTDRIIRTVVAIIFAGLNLFGVVTGTLSVILWIFVAVLLVTSAIGFCPLYVPFKFSTKGK
ncbi:MAG: DUF2892 domain-containing protein [Anaerolineales bacterium]|jgi:hypothetical protein|nr:DUF2892 domain-containing protein [Anaerolineales bacterium]